MWENIDLSMGVNYIKNIMKKQWICLLGLIFLFGACQNKKDNNFKIEEAPKTFSPPVSYENAASKANSILQFMSIDEKIEMIGGHDVFFTKGYPEYGIPSIRFSDATQGVSLVDYQDHLSRSVAFPAPIALASSWNTSLAQQYAKSIGEECRAGGIEVLLGPGLNIYRISQCGRNFEYFGEDPYLVSRMVENYVLKLQKTGTIATLKHFVANNTEHRRRTSNSIVSERALHEIYLPGFQAGIDAGAMAVMTSYNQLNGEYTAQSKYVIKDLLRDQLGFKWLVMSDWLSIWDAEKAIKEGLDLDMPGETEDGIYSEDDPSEYLKHEAPRLLREGKIKEAHIDKMVKNILTTIFAMDLSGHKHKEKSYLDNYDQHERVALETAREGIVLLKNNSVLPFFPEQEKNVLIKGKYADSLATGGGAAYVEGYDQVTLLEALRQKYGEAVSYLSNPSDEEIKAADIVLFTAGTYDSEGSDVPFNLPDELNNEIERTTSLNKNTVVIMYTGGGKNLTPWNDKAAAILYSWYPGQIGNKALAEIISGETNPSGKLPITIERDFKDSPGYPYLPEGDELYSDFEHDMDMDYPVYDIHYDEGVFVGYRWYEKKGIDPLYHFGHGLSYSDFEYNNFKTNAEQYTFNEKVLLKVDVKNTSDVAGKETVQLYVSDLKASVDRPVKELKGFQKVELRAGETKTLYFSLDQKDFAFWDSETSKWKAEPGKFVILLGSSSDDIRAKKEIKIVRK